MDLYHWSIQFPFTKTVLNFKELNCKCQEILTKINASLPPTEEYRKDYNQTLIEIFKQVLKEKNSLYDLNCIEFLMFAIHLRSVSVGNVLEMYMESKELDEKTQKNKKIKIEINLSNLMSSVYNISMIIEKYNIIKEKDVEIHIDWPNINSLNNFIKSKQENVYEKINDTLYEFVKILYINKTEINFTKYTKEQKEIIFGKLPVSIKNILQTQIFSFLNETTTISLFDNMAYLNEYKLNLYNDSIQDLIRLLYANNLTNLQAENVFLISKGFDLESINKMTPLEKQNYINLLTKHKQNEQQPNEASFSDAVSDLAREFGQI